MIYFTRNFERAFGTFPLRGDDLQRALRCAIDVGYRAIDTAQMYQNEAETGECIADSGVARDEFCITTKVEPDNFDKKKFIDSVEQSLKNLRISQVDVLLLHWPPIDGQIDLPLKLLQQAHQSGLAKHIGISNYTVAMMHRARELVEAPLVTNQVEFHPLLNQDPLLQAAKDTGIPLSSYCSVARGEVFKHSLFDQIGKRHQRSAGQVVLRWILQKGVSVNTMSSNPDNIEKNYQVADFELTADDMNQIDTLTKTNYRIVTRSLVPWAPEWDTPEQ